jgi:hypothetical protein
MRKRGSTAFTIILFSLCMLNSSLYPHSSPFPQSSNLQSFNTHLLSPSPQGQHALPLLISPSPSLFNDSNMSASKTLPIGSLNTCFSFPDPNTSYSTAHDLFLPPYDTTQQTNKPLLHEVEYFRTLSRASHQDLTWSGNRAYQELWAVFGDLCNAHTAMTARVGQAEGKVEQLQYVYLLATDLYTNICADKHLLLKYLVVSQHQQQGWIVQLRISSPASA